MTGSDEDAGDPGLGRAVDAGDDHDRGGDRGDDHDRGDGHDEGDGRREAHTGDDAPASGDGSPRPGGDALRLSVPGMDCPSCAGKVESALDRVDVESYEARPTTGTVVVEYDPGRVADGEVVGAVEGAGYEVAGTSAGTDGTTEGDPVEDRPSVWTGSRAVRTWIGGVFLALGLLVRFALPGWNGTVATVAGRELPLADAAFLVAVVVAGGVVFRNGYYSLLNRNLDIDLLMSVAIAGAVLAGVVFGESLYFEAATLAVLFGIAELLESYSMDRARASLRELMELSPEEATVRRPTGEGDGRGGSGEEGEAEEVTVPVEAVRVGDLVVVRPGEKIPVDGEVVEGESAVDQSPVTGESVPVGKAPGDPVYAGTVNEEGYLEVETAAAAGEDTLSRIVELVEDARASRTEREQFVDRFAGYYTPVVVAFAVLVAVVPPLALGGAWPTYVVYGLTLLVLACPCAFVISTPVSVVSGITSAARNGVLIRGGDRLEAMGSVGAVALDKTGTVTRGELAVTDVVGLNGNTEAELLRCARGLEARSEHPVGEAIVAHAADEGVEAGDVKDFESITGKGVTARLDGTTHYAGKPGLFEELGFDLSHVHATTDGGVVAERVAEEVAEGSRPGCDRDDCLDLLGETVPRLQSEGKTVVLVGTEHEIEGAIAVADEVRPESRRAVRGLHELGIEHVVVLTGDNERTARAIADEVGVDGFRAELLPEEKVDAVRALDREYGGVAMVGDGVNDAPALATATVGVAMGAAGTDTALETADVALMSDDLSKLPYLYELAGEANGVIRGNVWASLGVKVVLALGVPFGLVPIWLAVLAGDAGMTTAVTANAMRLARIEADHVPEGIPVGT